MSSDKPETMPGDTTATTRLVLAELASRKPTRFRLTPDDATNDRIAAALGIPGLRKTSLAGEITPKGRHDWALTASLGATATQSCVVTLAPVTTRIDTTVERLYLSNPPEPKGDEEEMPEDDRIEPLPAEIDLIDLVTEALALELPDYPRAKGVAFGQLLVTPPGAEPLTDQAAKPFAGLAALKDQLKDKGQG